MVDLARKQLGQRAQTDLARLGEPLSYPAEAFDINQLSEPRPTESTRELFPNDYDSLNREPGFLILRLLSPR
jgi:hypothetical protein